MRIILAPMEGLVDAPIRETLTGVGGIDRCVTEFVRVTHGMLPPRVFYKYAPELYNRSLTQVGTPLPFSSWVQTLTRWRATACVRLNSAPPKWISTLVVRPKRSTSTRVAVC